MEPPAYGLIRPSKLTPLRQGVHVAHGMFDRAPVTRNPLRVLWRLRNVPSMTLFTVYGPMEVPAYYGKAARAITEENIKEFWHSHSDMGSHRGCYVFGIRAGKGFTPGYVGKATKSFKQEVFTSHKLAKYQRFLADYNKGTPILFFVVPPKLKGKTNTTHIGELEDFLIQVGVAANPHLLNIKGTRQEDWGISGVIRSGKGKPGVSARALKAMLKL